MNEHAGTSGQPEDPIRVETVELETGGEPAEVDVDIPFGSVTLLLGDGPFSVTVRHDPQAHLPWTDSVTSLLNWVGERFGAAELAGTPAEAVAQCRIEAGGGRIVVRGPGSLPLHAVPLGVTVHAPEGSSVRVRAAAGPITVDGTCGGADLSTGSGAVRLGDADGAVTVRAGGGDVTAGTLRGGLQLRGTGEVAVGGLAAPSAVSTSDGDVRIGEVSGDVLVRTSSGHVTVENVASGAIDATTGSGTIRVGIGSGVAAEIDLSSGSGRAVSELDVSDMAPDRDVPVSVRARTGVGDAIVTSALTAAAR
ncbi:DUF4097 family beta strand repeat-containing protein [Prauserella rugosa]|uniref:DUF4097 domain-containing protein n=1 Tax=Prauserella rugosa TaxID=43354 RepID=A0A660C627_9PSEU|nr:DUF4097 family beta strand repeat-containing protein [Prauserella rugosa]KMS82420.1 hypothetical protein ACZ91_58655 [Streptomyces regensis]TWH18942.1 hypothetical protein JD82_00764 [Prauserella rugosa]